MQTSNVDVTCGTDAQCAPLHDAITNATSDSRRAEGVTPYGISPGVRVGDDGDKTTQTTI